MNGSNEVSEVLRAMRYAAGRHASQRRKGVAAEPYVNHVVEVAERVARSSHGPEVDLVIGALLHDIIEDTEGSYDEIAGLFGFGVADLVQEVSDDKSLPKAERKRLQVETTPHKSANARRIKLADKAANLAALMESPPADWDRARLAEYVDWAKAVAEGCRGVDPALEAEFDAVCARADSAFKA